MRITILGLEQMRTAMAIRLAKAGHEVTLYSRTRKGAAGLADTDVRVAFTVAAAVNQAQVAITVFSNDAAEDALTFYPGGLLHNLPSGAIHLCMSTLSVEVSRRLAAAHAEASQGYVAAPILGLTGATASGNLRILAAGPEIQVIRCLGILETLSQGVTRVGPRAELAHALKLGASAFTVALVEALAETLAFGEKAGIAPSHYLAILNQSLFKSPLLDVLGGLMVRHDHEPAVQTVASAAGDLTMLLQAARELNVGMPLAQPLLQQLQNAKSQGLAERDLTVLSRVRSQDQGKAPAAEGAPDADRRRPDRRKASEPRKDSGPEKRKAASAGRPAHAERRKPVLPTEPAPEPPAPAPEPAASAPAAEPLSPTTGARYLARADDGTVELDAWKTTHFECLGGTVWAWVDGARHATFWNTLAEVQDAVDTILFVQIQPRILVNPNAVKEIKPLLWGRARVLLAGGTVFTAGRKACRTLAFLLH